MKPIHKKKNTCTLEAKMRQITAISILDVALISKTDNVTMLNLKYERVKISFTSVEQH